MADYTIADLSSLADHLTVQSNAHYRARGTSRSVTEFLWQDRAVANYLYGAQLLTQEATRRAQGSASSPSNEDSAVKKVCGSASSPSNEGSASEEIVGSASSPSNEGSVFKRVIRAAPPPPKVPKIIVPVPRQLSNQGSAKKIVTVKNIRGTASTSIEGSKRHKSSDSQSVTISRAHLAHDELQQRRNKSAMVGLREGWLKVKEEFDS